MTLCIGALCEDRKTIILAADKMVGQGFIEAELEIEKILRIHPDWWLLFAGTVPHVFDIFDGVRRRLDENMHYSVDEVITVLEECYRRKRMERAEATYLTPRGWILSEFQGGGRERLGDLLFQTLDASIANYRLDLELLVAGFDKDGLAHLVSVENPGISSRHDIPGYHAIGNGMFGALYFMFYRSMSVKMNASEGLYHTFEAQVFGYQAGSIGEETDFVVARFEQEPIRLQESALPILMRLWNRFAPRPTKSLDTALGKYVSSSDLKSKPTKRRRARIRASGPETPDLDLEEP